MKLVWAYLKVEIMELLRLPAYLVPTLAFPGLMFTLFGIPNADSQAEANQFMAAYATFTVLGVAFFQFGVGIATDRQSTWEIFLRTLPVSPQIRFTARVLAALTFALAAVGVIFILGITFTPAGLEAAGWFTLRLALLLGSVPFGLLGIALGYWTHPRAALPIANLLWVFLAYGGGLWLPPNALPDPVKLVSPYLPTRLYAESTWAVVLDKPWQLETWLGLVAYTVGIGLLAVWGYHRDEGQNYR